MTAGTSRLRSLGEAVGGLGAAELAGPLLFPGPEGQSPDGLRSSSWSGSPTPTLEALVRPPGAQAQITAHTFGGQGTPLY